MFQVSREGVIRLGRWWWDAWAFSIFRSTNMLCLPFAIDINALTPWNRIDELKPISPITPRLCSPNHISLIKRGRCITLRTSRDSIILPPNYTSFISISLNSLSESRVRVVSSEPDIHLRYNAPMRSTVRRIFLALVLCVFLYYLRFTDCFNVSLPAQYPSSDLGLVPFAILPSFFFLVYFIRCNFFRLISGKFWLFHRCRLSFRVSNY